MMQADEFRAWAHQLVDWTADYYANVDQYPVKSQVLPREIFDQLPAEAPVQGERMEDIWKDFQEIILPGMTHWQHPGFMAYFPANSSYPSLLAEMLSTALAAQCMIWETSPAATELEERMMHWLRQLLGIPEGWDGVIQSTASEATLCAILSARERATAFASNEHGLRDQGTFRVYASEQIHSSIEKAVKIAGIGRENFIPIATDGDFAMNPMALEQAILADVAAGYRPLCIVAGLGTTSSTAIDPLPSIADIAQRHHVWVHVDAAYAGAALLLPEYRWMSEGLDLADSFVFNPHKWMLTHFDCSTYFVKDKASLIRTFEILPEYLRTAHDQQVHNYRDWGIPLGRRFRALKLWFVMRSFGVEGIQTILRNHIVWAKEIAQIMEAEPDFELLAPVSFNLICFRYCPSDIDPTKWNELNKALLALIQQSGTLYLTHTQLRDQYTLRMVAGQPYLERSQLLSAWKQIRACAISAKSAFSSTTAFPQ